MSQIGQCDNNDCYNMEFNHSVHHIDSETESFLLEHFKRAFKSDVMIDDICDECIDQYNSDYEELFVFDACGDLSINQKYIDNPELLESK